MEKAERAEMRKENFHEAGCLWHVSPTHTPNHAHTLPWLKRVVVARGGGQTCGMPQRQMWLRRKTHRETFRRAKAKDGKKEMRNGEEFSTHRNFSSTPL